MKNYERNTGETHPLAAQKDSSAGSDGTEDAAASSKEKDHDAK